MTSFAERSTIGVFAASIAFATSAHAEPNKKADPVQIVNVASVNVANAPARFSQQFFTGQANADVIPKTTVPAGKKLIIDYINFTGTSTNVKDHPLTTAGCGIKLQTGELNPPAINFPTHQNVLGITVSETTYIALSQGEGLSAFCDSAGNLSASWWVVIGGHYVPAT